MTYLIERVIVETYEYKDSTYQELFKEFSHDMILGQLAPANRF